MPGTSAKAKSNVVAIDHSKVKEIADRMNAENGEVELLDPEYIEPNLSEVILGFSESQIKTLWEELKLLNDTAYIVFAVIFDKKAGRNLEVNNFVYRWQGQIENKKGDVKRLKPSTVLAVTEKMEKQGLIERKKVRISMEIEMQSILDEKTGQYQLPLD